MTVPPEARCTLPECDREAVDPWCRGALCEFHRNGGETNEPVIGSEASGGSETPQEPETGSVPTPLDELGDPDQFTLQAYLWADLKDYYDGDLSRDERLLLENPEAYLPTSAVRSLGNLGGP